MRISLRHFLIVTIVAGVGLGIWARYHYRESCVFVADVRVVMPETGEVNFPGEFDAGYVFPDTYVMRYVGRDAAWNANRVVGRVELALDDFIARNPHARASILEMKVRQLAPEDERANRNSFDADKADKVISNKRWSGGAWRRYRASRRR